MKLYFRALIGALLLASLAQASPSLAASPPTQHVRGQIVSLTPSSLLVKTASGNVTLALSPKTGVIGAVPGSIADIGPGKFLGIASAPGTGPNRALEVTVFPNSMRGTGEGDYPWDSTASAPHSMMTNGTVAAPQAHSMMTNGTAGGVSGSGTKTITLAYKGGSRTLAIPPNTPVIVVAPGSKTLLAPGDNVFAVATKGSAPSALFIVVGEHGITLPL